MNVLGLLEVHSARTERRRADELAELRARVTAARGLPAERGRDRPPPVVQELIALADRLAEPGQGDGHAVARRTGERIDRILALCEVAPITDDGAVDFLRHEVVDDRPTSRPELADHIAATVRPGYRWRSDLLRPQQVVAFVHDGP